MFTIRKPATRLSKRRDFLRVGALGWAGGLTLADVLRLQAQGNAGQRVATGKSVIMVYLPGGPSHIDMYDLKPEAPREYRGEFLPIPTNVPGLDVCELMPKQAAIADKFALINGMRFQGAQNPYELLSGFPAKFSMEIRTVDKWPAFGSVVSRLKSGDALTVPPYVNLNELRLAQNYDDPEVRISRFVRMAPVRPV